MAWRLWALNTQTGDARSISAGMPPRLANIQALAFSPDGSSLAAIVSTTAFNDARGVWFISWPGRSARLCLPDAAYLASESFDQLVARQPPLRHEWLPIAWRRQSTVDGRDQVRHAHAADRGQR